MFGNLIDLAASVAKATDAVTGLVTKPIKDGLDVIAEVDPRNDP